MDESMPSLAFSLKSASVRLDNNEIVVLEVTNRVSESEIEHNKQKIVTFIKEKTGVDSVVMQVKCKEFKQKRKIYSPSETYQHFKAKRPAIEALFKAFDCEFEY